MELSRVVETWCAAPGDGRPGVVGSAYLISDVLVLTARHCVDREHGEVHVRPLGRTPSSRWYRATVVWPANALSGPGPDLAVLQITDPEWVPPRSRRRAVDWGEIVRGDQDLPCVAVGFPDAEAHPGNVRDTKEIRGVIPSMTGVKGDVLEIHPSHSAVPKDDPGGSLWSGASGAAVFCGRWLVGVVVQNPAAHYRSGKLTAVPVTACAEALRARGALSRLHEVSAAAIRRTRRRGTYVAVIAILLPLVLVAALVVHALRPGSSADSGAASGNLPTTSTSLAPYTPLQGASEIVSGPLTIVLQRGDPADNCNDGLSWVYPGPPDQPPPAPVVDSATAMGDPSDPSDASGQGGQSGAWASDFASAQAAHAVPSTGSDMNMTIQAQPGRTVVLTGMRLLVSAQRPPVAGAFTGLGYGCGGMSPRSFRLNLDAGTVTPGEGQPETREHSANPTDSAAPPVSFPYKVAEDDPEIFFLYPVSVAHDSDWRLELDWASDGKAGRTVIDDNGRPFRFTATAAADSYRWTDSGWVPGGYCDRCLNANPSANS